MTLTEERSGLIITHPQPLSRLSCGHISITILFLPHPQPLSKGEGSQRTSILPEIFEVNILKMQFTDLSVATPSPLERVGVRSIFVPTHKFKVGSQLHSYALTHPKNCDLNTDY